MEVSVIGRVDNGWYKVRDDITLKEGFVNEKSLKAIPTKEDTTTPKVEEPKVPEVEEPTPTEEPVEQPKEEPTVTPTEQPTVAPTETPQITPEPTPAPTPAPTPEPAPSVSYSADEAIGIVHSTLQGGGMRRPEEVFSQELINKYGPTVGMGYSEVNISLIDPQSDANSLLGAYQYGGYNLYYIENLGVVNGEVRLRTYYGTE